MTRPDVAPAEPAAEGALPVPVAFVSPSAELAGGERYLLSLLEQLGPRWASGIVLLADGPAREEFAPLDVPIEVLPTGARLGVITAAWRLRRSLARQRPTVVHANGVKAALVAVIAARPLGVPVVWVKHDFSWDGRLARWIGDRCSIVVGVSNAVTEVFAGRGVDVRVVANGLPTITVDEAAARVRLLEAVGLDEGAEVILTAGRMETGKGQLHLVEQMPRILAERPRAHLAIAGPPSRFDVPYEGRLRRRARELGVEHATTLLGYRADVIELMAGADVVAISTLPYTRPGTGEGFGLVAAESMAVGTPVVAYAHGGLPEVIGDAGVLVPAEDQRALGDALVRVLHDPALRGRLVEQGRRRAGTFELAAVADAMRGIYREAAGLPAATLTASPAPAG